MKKSIFRINTSLGYEYTNIREPSFEVKTKKINEIKSKLERGSDYDIKRAIKIRHSFVFMLEYSISQLEGFITFPEDLTDEEKWNLLYIEEKDIVPSKKHIENIIAFLQVYALKTFTLEEINFLYSTIYKLYHSEELITKEIFIEELTKRDFNKIIINNLKKWDFKIIDSTRNPMDIVLLSISENIASGRSFKVSSTYHVKPLLLKENFPYYLQVKEVLESIGYKLALTQQENEFYLKTSWGEIDERSTSHITVVEKDESSIKKENKKKKIREIIKEVLQGSKF